MNFKEKLSKALGDSVSNYNGGMDANEAIAKSAQANNFNMDQTERLVELFNTAKTINHFNSNKEDRTADFDIAKKAEVTKIMLSDKQETEKKASYDYSFYDRDECNYSKRRFSGNALEKSAESIENSDCSGYSKDVLSYEAMKAVRLCKQAASTASDTENTIRGEMITTLYKLAESLKKGYEPEARYFRFKQACCEFPITLKNLEKVMPERFTKYAEDDGFSIIDDSDLKEEKELAKQIEDLSKNLNSFHMMSVSWSKKANDLMSEFMKSSGLSTSEEKESVTDLLNTSEKKAALFGHEAFKSVVPEVSPDDPDSIVNKSIEQEKMRLIRQDILQDLLTNDEIVRDADPREVAQIYSSLIQTAPYKSLDREMVRSILRTAVNSVAISPVDVNTWANVEKTTRQALGTKF